MSLSKLFVHLKRELLIYSIFFFNQVNQETFEIRVIGN